MRSASLTTSIIASIILSMMLLATPVSGEQEPNDSLEDPDMIDGNEFTGTVSVHPEVDFDFIGIDIPSYSSMEVSIKKTDDRMTTMNLSFYNQDMVAVLPDYYICDLEVPGEVFLFSWTNEYDHPIEFYILIEGTGSYRIGAVFDPLYPSLDDPLVMAGNELIGTVSDMGEEDHDFIQINIPSGSTMRLSIKKIDNNNTPLEISLYDEDKIVVTRYYDMDLSFPGEVGEFSWENDNNATLLFYVLIEGMGTYRLTTYFDPILPEGSWHSFSQDAEEIDEGAFAGIVHDSNDNLPRRHFYSFDVPASSTVRVSLNKTGGDDGTLKLYYDYMYYVESDAVLLLTVSEVGENETEEFDNTNLYDEEYFLMVEGTGEYTLTVEIEDDSGPGPTILIIIMLIFMIMISLAPIVIIIIIIVIIVIIVKRSSSRKHADIMSRSTAPGSAYPPQYPPQGAAPPPGAPPYHYPPPPGPQVAPPPPPPPPKQ